MRLPVTKSYRRAFLKELLLCCYLRQKQSSRQFVSSRENPFLLLLNFLFKNLFRKQIVHNSREQHCQQTPWGKFRKCWTLMFPWKSVSLFSPRRCQLIFTHSEVRSLILKKISFVVNIFISLTAGSPRESTSIGIFPLADQSVYSHYLYI